MSSIDDLDFNKLIAGLPNEEQVRIKSKLLKVISSLYASVGQESVNDTVSVIERAELAQKELGKILEEIREEKNLTIYAASKIAKIRPEQVQAIEGDEKILKLKEPDSKINYTAKVLFRYLQALGVKISIDNYLPESSRNI